MSAEPWAIRSKPEYTNLEHDPLTRWNLFIGEGDGINQLRKAQLEFLSGFFGGPQIYVDRNRHSDLRKIHAHVELGYVERDAWLVCMDRAIDQLGFEPELKERMMTTFTRAAEMSRNQD